MVGILVSFWDGQFSGAMLVSGRVSIQVATKKQGRPLTCCLLTNHFIWNVSASFSSQWIRLNSWTPARKWKISPKWQHQMEIWYGGHLPKLNYPKKWKYWRTSLFPTSMIVGGRVGLLRILLFSHENTSPYEAHQYHQYIFTTTHSCDKFLKLYSDTHLVHPYFNFNPPNSCFFFCETPLTLIYQKNIWLNLLHQTNKMAHLLIIYGKDIYIYMYIHPVTGPLIWSLSITRLPH